MTLPITLSYILASLLITPVVLLLSVFILRRYVVGRGVSQRKGELSVGFFHPFCNSGGGGERVLWQYVRTLQLANPRQRIIIYTGDKESNQDILQKAQDRFNLPPVPNCIPIEFVRLHRRRLVTAELYPRFTMIGQSIGSMILGVEALWAATPDVFVDTTGFAFTYPIAKLFGCFVHCYTHYPTISSDMLSLVFERRESYNNSSGVAHNLFKARVKWVYYKLFAFFYSVVGRAADLIFVNSTWTCNHIRHIWSTNRARVVYPPCDTESLRSIPLGRIHPLCDESTANDAGARQNLVVSIGQFRPEKDHSLQLRAFARFIHTLRSSGTPFALPISSLIRMIMIGGARDAGDRQRVDDLKRLARELQIEAHVEFAVNLPFAEMKEYLAKAMVGIHTMWNEHFGIGVVEFMAAGLITIAHNSGGPKSDILAPLPTGERVGYLASNESEYCSALMEIFTPPMRGSDAMSKMRVNARQRAMEYSDEVFTQQLEKHFLPTIEYVRTRQQKKQQ